jgi:GT2 family glycosyltransferase
MKLSVIILCWNDRRVIADCLQSIYENTYETEFEVIVSDNGSTDGSIDFIRRNHPQVKVIENGRNLRFAKGNNVAISASAGEYVLILNPDTIIRDRALDKIIGFADNHQQVGAFGCRVLNSDGSYQTSARPFASLRSEWIVALHLRWLGRLWNLGSGDAYPDWKGETERQVDWISGCFMLVRANILKQLGGFDEQFFYYYEDMDLCRRIRQAGYSIIYTPQAEIIHLKGQSTNQRLSSVVFALDSQVTRYLYYYKYYGMRGARHARQISLVSLFLRWLGYRLAELASHTETQKSRLEQLGVLLRWNYHVDLVRLIEYGEEPQLQVALTGRVLER